MGIDFCAYIDNDIQQVALAIKMMSCMSKAILQYATRENNNFGGAKMCVK